MTYAEHAARARACARAAGMVDCIHYAPDWRSRVDALYEALNATGAPWWDSRHDCVIGILADGRMAVVTEGVIGIAEPMLRSPDAACDR